MRLLEIQFEEKASKRIYDKYMSQVKKTVKPLNAKEQDDILLEINSHIYEGLQQNKHNNEIDRLLDILDKLGVPDEVLKPLVADKKMEQATRSFNPWHMLKALVLNITNGISYLVFLVLYLMLFGFVFLIYSKLTKPVETGLFFDGNHFQALGRISPEYLEGTTTHELLGHWFIPAMLVAIVLFYILITLLIRIKRKINN